MRLAVMIIALCLTMLLGLQSCTILLGGSLLQDQTTASAGAVGLLLAFIFVLGAALAWGFPRTSGLLFMVGGGLALLASTASDFRDLAIWGCASVILSIMAFVGARELGRRQPQTMYAPPTQTILLPMQQPNVPTLYHALPEQRSTALRTAGMVVGWGLLLGLVAAALTQGDRSSSAPSPSESGESRRNGAEVEAVETAEASAATATSDAVSQSLPQANGPALLNGSPTSIVERAAASRSDLTEIHYASTVPSAFRGRWDEIVSDGCAGREARFVITATTIHDDEMPSDIARVKVYNPTRADISITGYDEDANRYRDVMQLELVGSGGMLKVGTDGTLYRQCPG